MIFINSKTLATIHIINKQLIEVKPSDKNLKLLSIYYQMKSFLKNKD
jgi:hypothetical protein